MKNLPFFMIANHIKYTNSSQNYSRGIICQHEKENRLEKIMLYCKGWTYFTKNLPFFMIANHMHQQLSELLSEICKIKWSKLAILLLCNKIEKFSRSIICNHSLSIKVKHTRKQLSYNLFFSLKHFFKIEWRKNRKRRW